jgi:hypothetical protein
MAYVETNTASTSHTERTSQPGLSSGLSGTLLLLFSLRVYFRCTCLIILAPYRLEHLANSASLRNWLLRGQLLARREAPRFEIVDAAGLGGGTAQGPSLAQERPRGAR